jgi:hypothetical protein
MSCASLGLILCPQTAGNHFDSRIFVRSSSFWWCSKDPRFPMFKRVRRQNFWGIASLFDAQLVPKPLSQQLLPFGRSGDGLEELTFGVEQFSALSMPRGRSAWTWRTVRTVHVRRVFFVFLLGFAFDPRCFRVLVGRSFGRSACAGRTVRGCLADSPHAPRGWFVIRGASLEVLLPFSDSPRLRLDGPWQGCRQSAIPCQTVCAAFADSPPRLAGQSTRAWLPRFLVRFLPPSFVLSRALQGIVPKM